MNPIIIEYNSARYDFRKWACEVLGVQELEIIHRLNKVKTCNISPTANQLAKSFSSILPVLKRAATMAISDTNKILMLESKGATETFFQIGAHVCGSTTV